MGCAPAVWELPSAVGRSSGKMNPKPSVWCWVDHQGQSVPWPQPVPLIPHSCSFENSFFPRPEVLRSTLFLQHFTTQLLSGRSQVSSQSLCLSIRANVSRDYFHLFTPERVYYAEPFFLINESESSFHISLYSIFFFLVNSCFVSHYVNILQFYLTTLSQMDTCTIIKKSAIVENLCIHQEMELPGEI